MPDAGTDDGVQEGDDAEGPADDGVEPGDAGGEPMGCEAPLGEGACADLTICDVFDCGGKTAPYNHFGCERTACTSNADCAAQERCFAVALETDCRAETGACVDADGTCACNGAESCTGVTQAHCLPTGFYPASEDCEVGDLDCEQLTRRLAALDDAANTFASAADGQLVAELSTCRERVTAAQSNCAGSVSP